MAYPRIYHLACNAAVQGGRKARGVIAASLRGYRKAGDRGGARKLRSHIIWIGYPIK